MSKKNTVWKLLLEIMPSGLRDALQSAAGAAPEPGPSGAEELKLEQELPEVLRDYADMYRALDGKGRVRSIVVTYECDLAEIKIDVTEKAQVAAMAAKRNCSLAEARKIVTENATLKGQTERAVRTKLDELRAKNEARHRAGASRPTPPAKAHLTEQEELEARRAENAARAASVGARPVGEVTPKAADPDSVAASFAELERDVAEALAVPIPSDPSERRALGRVLMVLQERVEQRAFYEQRTGSPVSDVCTSSHARLTARLAHLKSLAEAATAPPHAISPPSPVEGAPELVISDDGEVRVDGQWVAKIPTPIESEDEARSASTAADEARGVGILERPSDFEIVPEK